MAEFNSLNEEFINNVLSSFMKFNKQISEDIDSTLKKSTTTLDFITIASTCSYSWFYDLYELVSFTGAFICGGFAKYCAAPLFNSDKPTDIDIFCPTKSIYKNLIRLLRNDIPWIYEIGTFVPPGKPDIITSFEINDNKQIDYIESEDFYVVNPFNIKDSTIGIKLQVICIENGLFQYSNKVKSVEDIISKFDFSICRAGFVGFNKVLVDKHFIEDMYMKRLRIKYIKNPILVMKRISKYSKKGYSLDLYMELLKLNLAMLKFGTNPKYVTFLNKLVTDLQLPAVRKNIIKDINNVDNNTVNFDNDIPESLYSLFIETIYNKDFGIELIFDC